MFFNVKYEVHKSHCKLKNILNKNSEFNVDLINLKDYNNFLNFLQNNYCLKIINNNKVLFTKTFHKDKILLFLDFNLFFICDNIEDLNNNILKLEKRNYMKKNLWILTEERPKLETISTIIEKFIKDNGIVCFFDPIRILPILNENNKFMFTYEVKGICSEYIDKIYIKIISGHTSFVDFLVYYQKNIPQPEEEPLYGIEETKTDDSESRNTGIGQRAIKFFFLKHYYPNTKRIMLYNIKVKERLTNSNTNNFGTRCLLTLGVEFIGKKTFNNSLTAFTSYKEFISERKKIPPPPYGQPIEINEINNKITISAKLIQKTGKSHDPNEGTIGIYIAVLRFLNWNGDIEIINHSMKYSRIHGENKFTYACSQLKVNISGAKFSNLPIFPKYYWYYDKTSEKNATIFLHVLVDNFEKGFSIFENHASSEKGYFYTREGDILAIAKKIPLPDLILVDRDKNIIHNIEGERYINADKGIKQLLTFDKFENTYIKSIKNGYNHFIIQRSVVLFGGKDTEIKNVEISFILNEKGQLVLKINSPNLFHENINKLKKYWNN